jgi:NADPH:quinone reductase-like Zn-dependent oxidoreductase
MRAIVVREGGGPEVLGVEEVPPPDVAEDRVLVRVEAAAVNHFDLTQRRDPAATGATPPFTPGLEGAGTRMDSGERVLVTGTRGTYAEVVSAPADSVWPIPDTLGTAPAAGLGVAYKTAWAALAAGGLARGDTLLVQAGSSGTGQAAVDLGRHLGATVYATAGAAKHDRLRVIGAEPLAYDDDRLAELEADVVFDPVGGAAFEHSLAALGREGRLVVVGAVDTPAVSLNLWALISKRAGIVGTGSAAVSRDDFARIVELAGRGELHPVIDRELPLGEAAEAHRLVEARQVFGKILLRP